METETMQIERTRKGYPALWEEGGGMTNTGDSVIVAGAEGEPLTPVYIRRKGPLAGLEHALFVVQPGFMVVQARHHREDFTIRVMRIVKIDEEEATLEEIYSFSEGEWLPEEPDGLIAEAVRAAKRKATCYHCREVHYAAVVE